MRWRFPFAKARAAAQMRHANQPAFMHFFKQHHDVDFLREVGSGYDSSVIMLPVQWLMRAFPEPPLVVDKATDNDWEVDPHHALATLLARPNPHTSGEQLLQSTIASLTLTGNGYWIKNYDAQLRVVELWYAPPELVEPVWPRNGLEFISHYEYRPGIEPILLEPHQIVHFRHGTDPKNIRKGLSPLASVLREAFADDEAGRFTAALLKNMGVIGVIIAPEGDAVVGDGDLEAAKIAVDEHYTGSNRGKPFIAGAPTKVMQFGFNPEQMDLKMMRRVPEERVSAAVGVPAIVVGFGAGLDRATYANIKEAREMATETTLVQLWRSLASDIGHQLLPDFEPQPEKSRVRFDINEVRVLQEDQNALIDRKLKELGGGAIMLSTYLRETGRQAEPRHDIYLRPMNLVEVPEGELGVVPEPTPPPGGNGGLNDEERAALAAMTPEARVLAMAGANGNGGG